MTLYEQMKADLLSAIKARETATVAALRSLIAAIDNAQAVPLDGIPRETERTEVPRLELSEAEVRALLRREATTCRANVERYETLGRTAEAQRLRVELNVIDAYL